MCSDKRYRTYDEYVEEFNAKVYGPYCDAYDDPEYYTLTKEAMDARDRQVQKVVDYNAKHGTRRTH